MMRQQRSWVLLCGFLVCTPAVAQTVAPVFDASNYSENLLIAARSLAQINNEVQALQNQTQMLANMQRNLASTGDATLAPLLSDIGAINTLLASAQAIAFRVSATQAALAASYPDSYSAPLTATALGAGAQQRWADAMSAFKDALTFQAQIVENVQSDGSSLAALESQSQSATGNLAAKQAGNQFLALLVKQQLQTEGLLAEEGRANALNAARKAEDEAAAAADFTQFIGTANAYTPD
jgi:P-type conjugative transfer protein TrbJ